MTLTWKKDPIASQCHGRTCYVTTCGRFTLSQGSSGWCLTDHREHESRYAATLKSGKESAQRSAAR